MLRLARRAVTLAAHDRPLRAVEVNSTSAALQAPGAAFVTLTRGGALRGCIGGLEAHQSLAADVCDHAYAAAPDDAGGNPTFPS